MMAFRLDVARDERRWILATENTESTDRLGSRRGVVKADIVRIFRAFCGSFRGSGSADAVAEGF
jgi:hypothetical protein